MDFVQGFRGDSSLQKYHTPISVYCLCYKTSLLFKPVEGQGEGRHLCKLLAFFEKYKGISEPISENFQSNGALTRKFYVIYLATVL